MNAAICLYDILTFYSHFLSFGCFRSQVTWSVCRPTFCWGQNHLACPPWPIHYTKISQSKLQKGLHLLASNIRGLEYIIYAQYTHIRSLYIYLNCNDFFQNILWMINLRKWYFHFLKQKKENVHYFINYFSTYFYSTKAWSCKRAFKTWHLIMEICPIKFNYKTKCIQKETWQLVSHNFKIRIQKIFSFILDPRSKWYLMDRLISKKFIINSFLGPGGPRARLLTEQEARL